MWAQQFGVYLVPGKPLISSDLREFFSVEYLKDNLKSVFSMSEA